MSAHSPFIFAAYALTFLVVAVMTGAIIRQYYGLRRALEKFPPRKGGDEADGT